MWLGQSIALGQWLGPYNEFTLVKGPWLSGLSGPRALARSARAHGHRAVSLPCRHGVRRGVSLLCEIVRALGSAFYASVVAPRFVDAAAAADVAGFDVLRGGASVSRSAHRALFCARTRRHRWALALFAGAVFGWFWLTREESIWVVPGVAILFAAAALHAFTRAQAVSGGFGAADLRRGLCRGERRLSFGQLVGLRQVRRCRLPRGELPARLARDPQRPLGRDAAVRIRDPQDARAAERGESGIRISEAVLQLSIDRGRMGLLHVRQYPASCGEIATGWFIFALRDAVSKNGHYASPQTASAFFGKMADEINSACQSGKLECRPNWLPRCRR